jgi:hypothetical protein
MMVKNNTAKKVYEIMKEQIKHEISLIKMILKLIKV